MNKLLRFQIFSTLLLGCALCVISIEASQQKNILHYAAASGQVAEVRKLLKTDSLYKPMNIKGYTILTDSPNTLLHIANDAPTKGGTVLTDSFITLGPIIEHAYSTELYDAAANGQVARVRELLKSKFTDVNTQYNCNDSTALMAAVSSGSLETVQEFLDAKGIKVNLKNGLGENALMWASIRGRTAIVEKLLSVDGIDIDAQDNKQETALLLAAYFGHAEVVELLVKAGADKTLKDGTGRIPAECCVISGLPKTIKDLLALEASE